VAAGGALAAIIYNSSTGGPFTLDGQTVGAAHACPPCFVNQADGADLTARVAGQPRAFRPRSILPARTAFANPHGPHQLFTTAAAPNIGSAMKPDIVAVGEEIVTAAQNSFPSGECYDAIGLFIDNGGEPDFSTPLAAGAVAVLKAARRDSPWRNTVRS